MVPLNYGTPRAAAELADQARQAAGTRPTAAAVLAAAVAARAHALNHQSEQARAALIAADALMDRLPEAERSDTWLTYGEQKQRAPEPRADHARGHPPRPVESRAGAGAVRADQHQDAHPAEHRRRRLCRHDGDTEQACHRTVAALASLPTDYRTGLVRRRALDLYEAIPTEHHREHAVRELRDILAV